MPGPVVPILTLAPGVRWCAICVSCGKITFTARRGDKASGDRNAIEEIQLSGIEFVRRWSQHILAKGLVRTRRFGGYSTHHRKRYLRQCRDLLELTDEVASPESSADTEAAADQESETGLRCECCGGRMTLISAVHRLSWQDVFCSSDRPSWYFP